MDSPQHLIVGGGTSGAVLAMRLAAAGRTVLVLEGGRDYTTAQTPGYIRDGSFIAPLPDAEAFYWPGLVARRSSSQDERRYRSGRGIGGSSSVNAQYAVRPPLSDFDAWAAIDSQLWNRAAITDAFSRLERDLDHGASPYHGSTGPMPIVRPPRSCWNRLDEGFATAAQDLGHPWSEDHNAPDTRGVSPFACNAPDHRRTSVNDAYLEPVRHLPNLKIVGSADVGRIDVHDGRAHGVIAVIDGVHRRIAADEVVLTAGAIQTPCLLQRSGIGDPDHLRAIGVDVRHPARAVGQYARDHASLAVRFPLVQPIWSYRQASVVLRWGSAADPAGLDLQMNPIGPVSDQDHQLGGIRVTLMRCNSEGLVRVRDKSLDAPPRIELRLLSDPRDMDALVDGWAEALRILASPPMKHLRSGPLVDSSGTEVARSVEDRNTLAARMLATVDDAAHICGTCRMGNVDESVVDGQGRVHGIAGLRIADLSIAPVIPQANTHLTAIMLAEAIAGAILA